jgi:hypothetical protein
LDVLPASKAKTNVREIARSTMSTLNLARDSFEVTPSVRKVPSKRTATILLRLLTNFVLSENIVSDRSEDGISCNEIHLWTFGSTEKVISLNWSELWDP